ncbi:hypothetical protein [Planctomicrobium sp. SH664]|uniref:hypothetical protein n=1 Tax=Planctomicrobium sp. SH664 TaxID=3448125 RepID=UPI003F5C5069
MKRHINWKLFAGIQVAVVGAFGLAFALSSSQARGLARQELLGIEAFQPVPIPREEPLRIKPLYNRPDLVTDEDLAAVLRQVQPPFDRKQMKPNHVEHALRTWGAKATFQNPKIVSGQEMLEFLTDTAKYYQSWGTEVAPLLLEQPNGVAIRWEAELNASYHHDHWLACVTEAGAPLNTPVYGVSRRPATLYDVVQQSLRDFRLDERETEWSAMGFGFWICPTKSWIGSGGREYSFDLLADRLRRGQKQTGVCVGTHRVYSLMVLIRLDDEFDILSDEAREASMDYLRTVRDAITVSQFEDGHWPSNWPDGADAVADPIVEDDYKKVIATGHHLEWLSIAPPELHPPEEQIRKAMQWVIRTTKEKSHDEIKQNYTFFSHVGAALCNWRQQHPAEFWREWEGKHPYRPEASDTAAGVPAKPATPSAEAH